MVTKTPTLRDPDLLEPKAEVDTSGAGQPELESEETAPSAEASAGQGALTTGKPSMHLNLFREGNSPAIQTPVAEDVGDLVPSKSLANSNRCFARSFVRRASRWVA